MESCRFSLGETVKVIDRINTKISVMATVKLIEQDVDIPDLFYIYLVAVKSEYNDKFEHKVGQYWDVFGSHDPYIRKLTDEDE